MHTKFDINKENDILIVDDSEETLKLLSDILINAAYNVRTAINGKLALQLVEEKLPFLILMDVKMPDINGTEVCKKIKSVERTKHIPIIFISALCDDHSKVLGYQEGCVDYITKPFRKEEILARVKAQYDLKIMQCDLEIQNKNLLNEINERKIKEKLLEEKEHLYHTLFENANDAIFTIKEFKFFNCNQMTLQMFGCTIKEDIINHYPWEFSPEQQPNGHRSKESGLEKLNNTLLGIPQRFYWLHKKQNGDLFDAEVSLNKVEVDGIIFIQAVVRDVSNRIQSEKQNFLLAQTLKSAQDLISITDLDNNIIFVNDALLKAFRYNEEDLIGKNIDILRATSNSLKEEGILRSTLEGAWYGELMNKRKDGTEFPIELWASLVRDNEGNPIAAVGIARDITERKKSEEELSNAKIKAEESDRLKTAFLHNISHEIRTPLNAIIGFSELINDSDVTDADRKQYSDIIIKSSDNLLAIINDIMSIATIEAGQEKLNLSSVNINKTIKFLSEQYAIEAQNKNISLLHKTDFINETTIVYTDETKLIQILSNLINNAIKFTKEGFVNIEYSLNGNFVEFKIEDTGIGIPDNLTEEIFKRFRQVETTNARRFGGSGLGLAISKSYVELLGGKIWLTSELNKGSIFYFTIPL